jgi:hypothetical protein
VTFEMEKGKSCGSCHDGKRAWPEDLERARQEPSEKVRWAKLLDIRNEPPDAPPFRGIPLPRRVIAT